MIPSTLCKLIQMCSIIVFFRLVPIAQDVFFLDAARRCMLDRNLKAKLFQALGETPFDTVKESCRIKIGRKVVQGKEYHCVSKRNSHTVVYKEEQGEAEFYSHIQYFLLHRPHCCHRVTESCHFCEPSPFAVYKDLSQMD